MSKEIMAMVSLLFSTTIMLVRKDNYIDIITNSKWTKYDSNTNSNSNDKVINDLESKCVTNHLKSQ